MENILTGGAYRNVAVRITGAAHKPPAPSEMHYQIKGFFATLPRKSAGFSSVELAAYAHAEFVKIHPFEDGNGKTSRPIMNHQLMANGFLRYKLFSTLSMLLCSHHLLVLDIKAALSPIL